MSDDARRNGTGEESMGDEVYQPAETDRDDVTYTGDAENRLDEPDYDEILDTGYSPPEKPRGVDETGTTAREQREGETLDERLAQEVPDVEPPPGNGIGDQPGMWGEPMSLGQSGEKRAGRLAAPEDPTARRNDVSARDVGIDGGAASAEEAAMHEADLDREPEAEDTEGEGTEGTEGGEAEGRSA